MDCIEKSYLFRAQSALSVLTETATPTQTKAAAFKELARTMIQHPQFETALNVLRNSPDEHIVKAVAQTLDADTLWSGPLAQELARGYVETIGQFSLFDMIGKYARRLTPLMRQCVIASDSVGNMALEGAPKPVIDLSLTLGDTDPLKACAIVVLSVELARATGPEGAALFERELSKAVTRAMNAAMLALFNDSGTSAVAAGADALASLRAGLAAAGPSEGYVCAVNTADANFLVTCQENRGATPRGGEFAPNVHLVTVDDLVGMIIFPASRFSIFDGGMRIASTGQGDVDMRDTPESPAVLTSLFQTNSTGILVERYYNVVGDTSGVVSVEGA